jgi:hypothetical protein
MKSISSKTCVIGSPIFRITLELVHPAEWHDFWRGSVFALWSNDHRNVWKSAYLAWLFGMLPDLNFK